LGEHGEGDVAVPADERAAFEVVDAQAGLEFPVVVFDSPADLRERARVFSGVRVSILDSQYLVGSAASGGHSTISRHAGRLPSSALGMSRLAGRIRMARKRERIAALGLVGLAFVPLRQVMARSACCPAAMAKVRRLVCLSG